MGTGPSLLDSHFLAWYFRDPASSFFLLFLFRVGTTAPTFSVLTPPTEAAGTERSGE
jgi:hypothetical protein